MAFKITVLNKDNEMKASMEGASQNDRTYFR